MLSAAGCRCLAQSLQALSIHRGPHRLKIRGTKTKSAAVIVTPRASADPVSQVSLSALRRLRSSTSNFVSLSLSPLSPTYCSRRLTKTLWNNGVLPFRILAGEGGTVGTTSDPHTFGHTIPSFHSRQPPSGPTTALCFHAATQARPTDAVILQIALCQICGGSGQPGSARWHLAVRGPLCFRLKKRASWQKLCTNGGQCAIWRHLASFTRLHGQELHTLPILN